MNVTVEQLASLQTRQDRVRNICIMAHVDHGKTSLSDHLIGANGLIHPKLQGELRYLDSREDEQRRGITMKASSISLLYVPGAATRPEGPKSVTDAEKLSSGYLINLIDSPGHVDFCSEVSTAARLSDGAVVVVDAVEGVRIQTHAVLRQAWEEKVTPCLFINKVDRLVLELCMTPAEAAQRLVDIVTHANMVVSAFQSERYISEADSVLATEEAVHVHHPSPENPATQAANASADDADAADTFQPALCNVAFGSAHDGWAFRLDQFAAMYAEKLGCRAEALTRALWGSWRFDAKEKRVVPIKHSDDPGKYKSMFVQFAIEPLWKAYSVCEPGADVAGVLGAIVRSRGLQAQVGPRALEQADARLALRSVLRAWLPLSEAVLGMAVSKLPGPAAAAPTRVPHLLACTPGQLGPQLEADLPSQAAAELRRLECCVATSSAAPEAPLVIYVSKMVSVPVSVIPRLPGEPALSSSPDDEVFLAFGRVYSGTARPGQTVHVLSAAYSPDRPASQHRQVAVLGPLYMMMGRALERLQSVPAGNVLAIAGLESAVLKSATLSSTPACRPLAPMMFQAAPIVKVAVEPALPSEMPQLLEGLRLLNRADPFVEVSVMESGEHVLGAAGEVHLETCIKDLQERFAKIKLLVSPPLVAFRETVAEPVAGAAAGAPSGAGGQDTGPAGAGAAGASGAAAAGSGSKVVEASTPNGLFVVRVRATALPGPIASLLDDQAETLRKLLVPQGAQQQGAAASVPGAEQQQQQQQRAAEGGHLQGSASGPEAQLREKLLAAAAEAGGKVLSQLQSAWQLGPKGCGPNLLITSAASSSSTSALAPAHPSTSSASRAASLFDAPPSLVVRAAKQGHQSGSAATLHPGEQAGAAAAGAGAAGAGDWAQDEGPALAGGSGRRWLEVPLGGPRVGVALGLGRHGGMDGGAGGGGENGVAGGQQQQPEAAASASGRLPAGLEHVHASIESGVTAGFQMASGAGPLCEEPMWGVVLELEARLGTATRGLSASASSSSLHAAAAEGVGGREAGAEEEALHVELQEDVYGPFSGQVMTAVAAACRRAVLESDPRLAEAMYLAQVQAGAEALSGVYAVLGRRRARVINEEMREGSDTFLVHAHLPVADSFGLAEEMRRRCSGAASVSLLLSHWERLQVDPFFVPTTEEEREEWGEEAVNVSNVARRFIDAVRRRKGLPVEEKVVKQATKQRTLKRNV